MINIIIEYVILLGTRSLNSGKRQEADNDDDNGSGGGGGGNDG